MQFLTAVLSLCSVAVAYGLPSARIVGGNDAPAGKYPFMVSLKVRGEHYCAGSILNSRYILTAAHCVLGLRPSQMTIHAGTYDTTIPGQVYYADKFIPHPEYDSETKQNDIGIIRVNGEMKFEEKSVYPVTTTNTGEIYKVGDNVTVAGWGKIDEYGPYPFRLQEIVVKITTMSMCHSAFPYITDNQICTLTKQREGTCIGDSGGPLLDKKGLLIGIVSYGNPCANGFPDVFTKFLSYKEWALEQLEHPL